MRYTLKTPYRDGSTHIILEPVDFIARQAALARKPWVNLTCFYGVFVLNSALRQQVTPFRRSRAASKRKTPAQRHAAMTWFQRLKQVFENDIETCDECGGSVKVITRIEDPVGIRKILDHLEQQTNSTQPLPHPTRRQPPVPSPDRS